MVRGSAEEIQKARSVPASSKVPQAAQARECRRGVRWAVALRAKTTNEDRMPVILQANVRGGEIAKHNLMHVDRDASVLDASKLMRKTGTTELLVTHEANGLLLPLGIVTANDIVTRVIAAGLDPAVLTAGDIAWSGMESAATTPPVI